MSRAIRTTLFALTSLLLTGCYLFSEPLYSEEIGHVDNRLIGEWVSIATADAGVPNETLISISLPSIYQRATANVSPHTVLIDAAGTPFGDNPGNINGIQIGGRTMLEIEHDTEGGIEPTGYELYMYQFVDDRLQIFILGRDTRAEMDTLQIRYTQDDGRFSPVRIAQHDDRLLQWMVENLGAWEPFIELQRAQ